MIPALKRHEVVLGHRGDLSSLATPLSSSLRYLEATVRAVLLLPALAAIALGGALRPATPDRSQSFRVENLTPMAAFEDGTMRSGTGLTRLVRSSWGGQITAADGEVVTVYLSDAYPVDPAVQQSAADFLTELYHGKELSTVSVYLAPLDEVGSACGRGTGGCYSRDRIVATGDPLPDGTSAVNVLAHEYGHHVAANRGNAPWDALDWGPKRWATTARICARTAAGTAFPGDEGINYQLNPGEGWAEVYRLSNFLKQAWPSWVLTTWRIVDESFYPDARAFGAARADVLQPWTGPRKRAWAARLRNVAPKGRPTKVPRMRTLIATPLDGDVTVRLQRAPAGTTMSLATLGGKVVAPAVHTVLRTTVCDRRQMVLTVRAQKPGAFAATISTP
jgi:hypothetical protein